MLVVLDYGWEYGFFLIVLFFIVGLVAGVFSID